MIRRLFGNFLSYLPVTFLFGWILYDNFLPAFVMAVGIVLVLDVCGWILWFYFAGQAIKYNDREAWV